MKYTKISCVYVMPLYFSLPPCRRSLTGHVCDAAPLQTVLHCDGHGTGEGLHDSAISYSLKELLQSFSA